MILQTNHPDDFVIATGRTTTVRDFVKKTFLHLGLQIEFIGSGVNEYGVLQSIDKHKFESIVRRTCPLGVGHKLVAVDPQFFRPVEVENLCGDSAKAYRLMNWSPETSLEALISEMLESDIQRERSRQTKNEARTGLKRLQNIELA
jgi:GDPmannose 4,6-dehydratase